MKKKELVGPLLGQILRKVAPKLGAIILVEPEWHVVGQITFKNGRRRYFRGSTLDLNPVALPTLRRTRTMPRSS